MINLLGIGVAYPETRISNEFLESLGAGVYSAAEILERTGVENRFSVLPLSYIQETGNEDTFQVVKAALETPTDVACRAAQMAMQRAGITSQDIGLIIAGGSTPLETTPSEAQRVGKRLGRKVPAYDVFCGAGDFALHMSTLTSWREERVPEYVLCLSVNAPTSRVNYRSGDERYVLGDAAAAAVVSAKHAGKLVVKGALVTTAPNESERYSFDLYGHAVIKQGADSSWAAPQLEKMFRQACTEHSLSNTECIFIGSQLSPVLLKKTAASCGISKDLHWHNGAQCGFHLGSSPMAVLAEKWEDVSSGAKIVMTIAGAGTSGGYVVLEAR